MIWKNKTNINLKDYTVIIPSVAVGNVGQLTCDLLISSLHMTKAASIWSTAVIPVVGYDPYNLKSDTLSGSCELYTCELRKIAVLQFRAPLVYRYAEEFLQAVVRKFKENNVKELIVLTSSFAHEKKHILTSPFRYVVNQLYECEDKLEMLKLTEHENSESTLKILGGGFAALLFNIAKETLPCLILYKYCSEGDNIPDAYDMIALLSNIVTISSPDVKISSMLVQPVSWKLLFGRPPPIDIY